MFHTDAALRTPLIIFYGQKYMGIRKNLPCMSQEYFLMILAPLPIELPRFLHYKCLYDYRRSYYDDVMEVLSSRRKGIRRNIPPAQTWAERYCRARSDPLRKVEAFNRYLDDVKLVTKTEISGNFYKHYSKEQFNRRFSPLLF
ncbi:hypothetical protein NQ318_017927 [Aromia moschata]|uniref:Uncharacterized protein n=1 Tax=Aromia moschata TaxID=1265417 RepID=A0AAV8YB63_9CUCU|nr:hypothetical protein NQ318_017927 [Aromia moschata]